MSKKFLICDDETAVGSKWLKSIQEFAGSRAAVLPPEELITEVGVLDRRQLAARKGNPERPGALKLDRAAVVFIDYDLLQLESGAQRAFLTGDRLSYLLRCYSTCGPIVLINQESLVPSFDLTLRRHPWSFADVHVSGPDLTNKWLWSDKKVGFAPWYWPNLLELSSRFETMAAEVTEGLASDETVLGFFGFSDETAEYFSREALAFLGCRTPDDLRGAKLTAVLTGEHGLQQKDRPKEKKPILDDDCMAKLIAARLFAWLDQIVLPGQDLLVDAPHLLERYPSILSAKRLSRSSINAIAVRRPAMSQLHARTLQPSIFPRANWTTRTCWFWRNLRANRSIAEVKDPFEIKGFPYTFCEDVSCFIDSSDARGFSSDLESVYRQRAAAPTKYFSSAGIRTPVYQPVVRLLT